MRVFFLLVTVLIVTINLTSAQVKNPNVKQPSAANKPKSSKEETIRWFIEKIRNNLKPNIMYISSDDYSIVLKGKYGHRIVFNRINKIYSWDDYGSCKCHIYGNGFYRKYGSYESYSGETKYFDEEQEKWELHNFIDFDGEEDLCNRIRKAIETLIEYNKTEKKRPGEAF